MFMKINNLCSFINKNYIASENLRNQDLIGYMDIVMDDINDRLHATFPVFSEWQEYVTKYNTDNRNNPDFEPLDIEVYSAIPARYLRTVVAVGAALNFFTNDEEGEQVSQKYYIQYERNMSNMIRDYMELVPNEFQNKKGGYISNSYNGAENAQASIEGIVINNGQLYDVF